MNTEVDAEFYDRADAHIRLANTQLEKTTRGKVSASFMYGAARFNAWVSACGFGSAEEMRNAKEETIEYFVKTYRGALVDHLDDYIENFDKYMKLNGDAGQ